MNLRRACILSLALLFAVCLGGPAPAAASEDENVRVRGIIEDEDVFGDLDLDDEILLELLLDEEELFEDDSSSLEDGTWLEEMLVGSRSFDDPFFFPRNPFLFPRNPFFFPEDPFFFPRFEFPEDEEFEFGEEDD